MSQETILAITIAMVVMAAAAAYFATLYYQGRKDARKYEEKADKLNSEVGKLKYDLACVESKSADSMSLLTMESIAEFLRKEKTGDVEVIGDSRLVIFNLNGEQFHIDCSRLPQQFILRKGYGGMKDASIHWDVLEQAAAEVSKSLVMLKMHVYTPDGYDFMIVSTTHTIAGLREDYNFFLSLIDDAEKQLQEDYWKIMAVAYPEECKPNENDALQNAEDVAMKMAQNPGGQNKLS